MKAKKESYNIKEFIFLPRISNSVKNKLSRNSLLIREYVTDYLISNNEQYVLFSTNDLIKILDISRNSIISGIKELQEHKILLSYTTEKGKILLLYNEENLEVFNRLSRGSLKLNINSKVSLVSKVI